MKDELIISRTTKQGSLNSMKTNLHLVTWLQAKEILKHLFYVESRLYFI